MRKFIFVISMFLNMLFVCIHPFIVILIKVNSEENFIDCLYSCMQIHCIDNIQLYLSLEKSEFIHITLLTFVNIINEFCISIFVLYFQHPEAKKIVRNYNKMAGVLLEYEVHIINQNVLPKQHLETYCFWFISSSFCHSFFLHNVISSHS